MIRSEDAGGESIAEPGEQKEKLLFFIHITTCQSLPFSISTPSGNTDLSGCPFFVLAAFSSTLQDFKDVKGVSKQPGRHKMHLPVGLRFCSVVLKSEQSENENRNEKESK